MKRYLSIAALIFFCAGALAGDKPLLDGEPLVDSVAAAQAGEAVLSATQYTFEVPTEATEVVITLLATPTTLDIDLEVRFGQRVEIDGTGMILSDYFSETPDSGSEMVRVTPQSNPPLMAGTYYIGVVNYTTQEVTFFLTASYFAEEATGTPTSTATPGSITETPTATPTSTVVNSPTPTPSPDGVGGTPTPTNTLTLVERADLDGDGTVSARDLLLLMSTWKQKTPG